ncbi:MAG: type II secretion system secretin GspD [Desulfobacteraceae bacterium]|nr:type II secretion system secretin GspD [Desulfobacteraceae bacterium]
MTRYLLRIVCTLLLTGALFTSPALAAGKGVVLNFNEVDISTMVKFISDLTGRNFILDDRVKGKISVFSPSKLSNEEAYNVFVSVLELKGFRVVQTGKVGKIVPSAGAKQDGFSLLPSGQQAPINENYIAQVNKLENISAQEALAFLQPMISKDGHISAFGPGNLLLMVDSSLNIRKLQAILQTIDTERSREGLEIIYLKYASAESAAATVKQWLSGNETARPAGQPATAVSATTGSVLADVRLNALLVFGNDNVKASVRELVAKLDVQPPEASSKVNVYYLENTDATEMAKVLDGVVKGISAQATATGQPGAAAPQTSPFESGKITITPDKASNSLVIMASLNDYNNLTQVIKKLDRRSKQVFVQVVIAEVSLDKTRDLGVQTGAVAAGVLGKYLQGGGLYDPFGAFGQILGSSSASNTGLGISSLIGNQLTNNPKPVTAVALLQALDTNGLVNVLSTPNILTSDNKEAEIKVGENVPLVGSTTQSTFGTTQAVERKDIGINLKIKPQISEGNYIRLDINQEISAVKASKGQAIDLVTTTRSAKTSIVVKDNETVVIGGLIQDQENETISKVPFLGDIPGLGWLFKTTNKSRSKTNLMILLIPHIIKDNSDLASITDKQRASFGESSKELKPMDVQKEISGK